MIRDGERDPLPAEPPGPRAVEALATVQDQAQASPDRRRRAPPRWPSASWECELRALESESWPGGSPSIQLGQVELSDLVQPSGLADQLALAATEADLDGESRMRRPPSASACSREPGIVLLERLEQRLAAQAGSCASTRALPARGARAAGSRSRVKRPPLGGSRAHRAGCSSAASSAAAPPASARLDRDVRAPALLGELQLDAAASPRRPGATRAARPRCAR